MSRVVNRLVPRNQFIKSVLTLMTGTSIAQAIPIALSPLLTRIYTPDDFGLFAVYMGLASVIGVIATGRYELAILLPEEESDAKDIVGLSIIITALVSFIIGVFILGFGNKLASILGKENLYKWFYFLPVSIFLTGSYQTLNYWFNRKRDFKQLAKNRVTQSSSTGFAQIPLGYIGFEGIGLLLGTIFGQLITTITLFKIFLKSYPNFWNSLNRNRIQALGLRFSDFPKFDVPTSFLNTASIYAPNILFTTVFGASFAGYFYLTQRVLQAPITLISTSFLDVFKEEATKSYREKRELKKVFLKTFKWLAIISIIPSFTLFFFIEDIFKFAFGEDWAIAGKYAKILIPAISLKFIANPLSFVIYVVEKQYLNLFGMFFYFIATLSAFFLTSDAESCIRFISVVMFIYYSLYILVSAKFARVW